VIARVLAAAAVLWAVVIPAAAVAATRPAGSTGWHAFGAAVYLFGGAICHQRPERSFVMDGAQLPVCARCAGIYLGAAVVAVVSGFSRTSMVRLKPDTTVDTTVLRWVLALALVPAAVSLIYEWTTGDVPSNWTRAATGVVLGGGVTAVVLAAVRNRVN
jgi:uncharacterized membrane protein